MGSLYDERRLGAGTAGDSPMDLPFGIRWMALILLSWPHTDTKASSAFLVAAL